MKKMNYLQWTGHQTKEVTVIDTSPDLAETDPWRGVSTCHFMTREGWVKYSTFYFKITMFAGMAGEISNDAPSMHISLFVLLWVHSFAFQSTGRP